MKKRAALLGALLAFLVLLVLRVASPPGQRAGTPAHAATAHASDDTAQTVLAAEPSAIAPAVFPHDEHVEDFEVECVECHHETAAAPLSFPHEDYFDDFWIDCTICHKESGTASLEPHHCSECHHSGNGNIADETLSAKVVIHKSCWQCHEAGTGVEASKVCADCHWSEQE